jgi:hypothetical protein
MKIKILFTALAAALISSAALHAQADIFWMNYVDSNWDTTTSNFYSVGNKWTDGSNFIINQSPLANSSYAVNVTGTGYTVNNLSFWNQGGGGATGFTIAGGTLTINSTIQAVPGMSDTINSFVHVTNQYSLNLDSGSTIALGGGGNFNGLNPIGTSGGTLWFASGAFDFSSGAWTVARGDTLKFTIGTGAPTVNLGNFFVGLGQSDSVDFYANGLLTADHYVIASYSYLTGAGFTNVVNLPAGYTLDYNYLGLNEIALVVPEPSTWAMMLGGLGMLTMFRRRRRA